MDFTPIAKKLQAAGHAYGVESLALEWDIAASSVYTLLNPYGDKNISFFRALHIMSKGGDISPLILFLEQAGYRVTKSDAEPDGEDMREEVIQAYQAVGDFLKRADKGEIHTDLLPFLEKALKELEDVFKRLREEQTPRRLRQ